MRDLQSIIEPTHPAVAAGIPDASDEILTSLNALYGTFLTGEPSGDIVADSVVKGVRSLPAGDNILKGSRDSASVAGWALGAFTSAIVKGHTMADRLEPSKDAQDEAGDDAEEGTSYLPDEFPDELMREIEDPMSKVPGVLASAQEAEELFGDKGCTDYYLRFIDSKVLRETLAYLGRLNRVYVKAHRDAEEGIAPYDVETGGDVKSMLTSSMALLAADDEEMELLWLDRLVNKAHLQWERQDAVPKGHGDFVIMLDRSYSMNSGRRLDIAKGVATVLCAHALRDGRTVRLYAFDEDFTAFSWKGKGEMLNMIQTVSRITANGGTEITKMLSHELATSKGKIQDAVFITDGAMLCDDAISDAYCERLDKDDATSHIVSLTRADIFYPSLERLFERSTVLQADSIDASEGVIGDIADSMGKRK